MNHESARGFIEWAQQEKQPEPWQVEQWKEAIGWFYRAAKSAHAAQLGPLRKKGEERRQSRLF